ncbi:MAG: DUF2314 domain-containing protein [Polyangiaceae bacterium]|nr:DUF2314 domain-containing protein [Polyangiaceae bacterium]MCB9607233.1 DUF2314 domain-containing protein [Polyangiaceae bacterium]
MAEATARAQATFKYLWRELTWEYRRIVPGLELSAVKAAFSDPGGTEVEHMWLSDISFDGDVVEATLLNSPHHLETIQEGDRFQLTLRELEDWMYVMGGRLYGGFTIQALRSQMPPGERKAHDQAWGFDFPPPERVELVPDWDNRAKPSALGRLFGKTSPAPESDPDREHPMSENMAPSLEQAIAGNREAFFSLGEDGLNTLHSLALGGSAAGVRVLLAHGADPSVKTANTGRTARDLAEMMGWPRVVELLRAAENAN